MPSSSWALQKALHAQLITDAALNAVLGAPRIYDDVPRQPTFPYVTYGGSTVRDWSTGTDDGHEHAITLHAWSRGAGRKPTHELLGALEAALDQQPLALDGHRLISIRHEFSDVRREADGETWHGILRLRAVTEAL
ncbi:MAG: DUF3168 domain-containing protein [Hyphomicrobiaceae bacterium]